MKHKKVELTELFFDLVFVYAISQMTSLIHHLHEGVISPLSFLNFLICLLVLVNTWMVQTVYTNRYGQNSLVNILFMLVNMMQVLALGNLFSNGWENSEHFYSFILLVIGLTAVLFFQYAYEYRRQTSTKDRKLIQFFLWMLSIRSILLLLSLLLPIEFAFVLSVGIILLTTLAPMFVREKMMAVPTNFPHLVERLSLLVIILFGEMLIGVAPYFTAEIFSMQSVLVFLIVANLFMFYIVEIDHLLDEKKQQVTGNALIYFHYPIFIGLSMTTVSLSFLHETDIQFFFLLPFVLTGLALFYAGTLANSRYNKLSYRLDKTIYIQIGLIWLFGVVTSLFIGESLVSLTILLAIVTSLMTGLMIRFNLQQNHR